MKTPQVLRKLRYFFTVKRGPGVPLKEMTDRRTFTRLLPFLPEIVIPKPRLLSGPEILRSFDGRDWSEAFIAHVKAKPSIARDRATMDGWFANALMRGWDERERQWAKAVVQAGAAHVHELSHEAIAGAVARGWCAEVNQHKIMDGDLAIAIVDEVMQLAA